MDWGDVPLIRPGHGKVAFEFNVLARCGDAINIGVAAPPTDMDSFLGASATSWGFQPPECWQSGNSEPVRGEGGACARARVCSVRPSARVRSTAPRVGLRRAT